jgi:hypothetical protein
LRFDQIDANSASSTRAPTWGYGARDPNHSKSRIVRLGGTRSRTILPVDELVEQNKVPGAGGLRRDDCRDRIVDL